MNCDAKFRGTYTWIVIHYIYKYINEAMYKHYDSMEIDKDKLLYEAYQPYLHNRLRVFLLSVGPNLWVADCSWNRINTGLRSLSYKYSVQDLHFSFGLCHVLLVK